MRKEKGASRHIHGDTETYEVLLSNKNKDLLEKLIATNNRLPLANKHSIQ